MTRLRLLTATLATVALLFLGFTAPGSGTVSASNCPTSKTDPPRHIPEPICHRPVSTSTPPRGAVPCAGVRAVALVANHGRWRPVLPWSPPPARSPTPPRSRQRSALAITAMIVLCVMFVAAFITAGILEDRANRAHVARRQTLLDNGFSWEDAERLATAGWDYHQLNSRPTTSLSKENRNAAAARLDARRRRARLRHRPR